jgi:hypothetical protein
MVKTTAYMLSPNEAFNGILWALSKFFLPTKQQTQKLLGCQVFGKNCLLSGFWVLAKKILELNAAKVPCHKLVTMS